MSPLRKKGLESKKRKAKVEGNVLEPKADKVRFPQNQCISRSQILKYCMIGICFFEWNTFFAYYSSCERTSETAFETAKEIDCLISKTGFHIIFGSFGSHMKARSGLLVSITAYIGKVIPVHLYEVTICLCRNL